MRTCAVAAAAAMLLVGCGGETQKPEAASERAAPTAGLYEATWTVSQLRSTDNSTPSTNLAQGATGTATACVGEGGAIDPGLFAEDGDSCTAGTSYVRNGRVSMDLTCKRDGTTGEVRQTVSGTSTAETLDAEVSSSTYLSGGNYSMIRNFTARRIGQCPPEATTTENVS